MLVTWKRQMTASDGTGSDRFTFFVALLSKTARKFPENCVFLMIVEMARVLCCSKVMYGKMLHLLHKS